MALRDTIDFFLYDWLATPGLTQRDRFADHSRETFEAVLDTCERIAREKYAPFNRTVDIREIADNAPCDCSTRLVCSWDGETQEATGCDAGKDP